MTIEEIYKTRWQVRQYDEANIPDKDLIKLNMNIEQGMKLVISGGIITPEVKDNLLKKKLSSRY